MYGAMTSSLSGRMMVDAEISDDSGRIQSGCVQVFSDWTSRHQVTGDVAPRLGSN